MTKKELKNAIEYIEDFIKDFKYDCQHQKETHSAMSSDDEEFKETLKILENIRDELKTHETPKKYLTYDDIMKLETDTAHKVRLNEHIYILWLHQCDTVRELDIWDDNCFEILRFCAREKRKDFINDLHLELVEE